MAALKPRRPILLCKTPDTILAQETSHAQKQKPNPKMAKIRMGDPSRYARICTDAAALAASAERKAYLMLEAVRAWSKGHVNEWPVGRMRRLTEQAGAFIRSAKPRKIREALLIQWCEVVPLVFHAYGAYAQAARAYAQHAAVCGASASPFSLARDRFLSAYEYCNAILMHHGPPESMRARIIDLKGAAGQLMLHLGDTSEDEHARWKLQCMCTVLRIEWLSRICYEDEHVQSCLAEISRMPEKWRMQYADEIRIIQAAHILEHASKRDDCLYLAMSVAHDTEAHPDTRGEALLILAKANQSYDSHSEVTVKWLAYIKSLPRSGAHVARAIARRLLAHMRTP